MAENSLKVRLTFIEPLLGTLPGNPELLEEHIASKHPNGVQPEEIEAVPEQVEKKSTYFARDDNKPMLWNYQIKGFLKEACEAMISTDAMTKEELKKARLSRYLYKKTIDTQLFVTPRRIPLNLPNGDELLFNERPLRAQTMQGERIALARSEEAPKGTYIDIEIIALNKNLIAFIPRWLDYGLLRGLGQWRNSSMGSFEWSKL